eukprot:g676.t1
MSCKREPSLGVGAKQTSKEKPRLPTVMAFSAQPKHAHLSVDDIERMVRDKINDSTRSFTVQRQRMYQLFGRPTAGITRAKFRNRLHCWGIIPTEAQIDEIFRRWDADGNGKIDFKEFMAAILRSDYDEGNAGDMYRGFSEPASTTFNDVMLAAVGQRRVSRPDERELYVQLDEEARKHGRLLGGDGDKINTLHRGRRRSTQSRGGDGGGGAADDASGTLEGVEQLIREKISAYSRGDNVEKANSYALFGRPSRGISRRKFKWKLNQWGVHLAPQVLDALFRKYDKDGNGVIDFLEFMGIFGGDGGVHPLSVGEDLMEKEKRGEDVSPKSRRPRAKRERNPLSVGGVGGGGGFGGGSGGLGGSRGLKHGPGPGLERCKRDAADNRRRRCPKTVRRAQRRIWDAAEIAAMREGSNTRDVLMAKLEQFGKGGGEKGNKGGSGSGKGAGLDSRGFESLVRDGLQVHLPYYQLQKVARHYATHGGGAVGFDALVDAAEADGGEGVGSMGRGRTQTAAPRARTRLPPATPVSGAGGASGAPSSRARP